MPVKTANLTGKYLYAIIICPENQTYTFEGIDGCPVYTISNGRIAAVVSDVKKTKIRPERKQLTAHHEVIRKLMEENTLLPISFGIIAEGTRSIQRILSQNQTKLIEQIHHVSDKMEMGIRVKWDVPNIFEFFVQTHPELRIVRDRFLGTYREPSQEDKIELGRVFDRILNEDREIFTEKVTEILSMYCFEIKQNKCRNEYEVMNLACLVDRDMQDRFEAGIFEAAGVFDNNFAFDFNGPWAPYNFVEIDLKL
jgi:hypothetical protein